MWATDGSGAALLRMRTRSAGWHLLMSTISFVNPGHQQHQRIVEGEHNKAAKRLLPGNDPRVMSLAAKALGERKSRRDCKPTL
ncbi:MAG: hypothetical protein BJ554DRAFT_5810, partial [Olpidium bornovanus]